MAGRGGHSAALRHVRRSHRPSRYRRRQSLALDYVTHAPDLPLWPGRSPLLGLGLWSSIPGTLLVEGAIFLVGIAIYVRATRPVDRTGSFALWAFLFVSAAMWASGPWSPPPLAAGYWWHGRHGPTIIGRPIAPSTDLDQNPGAVPA